MILRRTAAVAVTAALVLAGAAAAVAPAYAVETFVPAAPTGLSYGTTGADPRFSWDAVEGATSYKVEVATDPSFASGTAVASTTTYARSWVPTTAMRTTLGRDLFWRVTAFAGSTAGDLSEVAQVWADAAAAPELLAPADEEAIQYPAPVAFSWAPVAGAVSYTVSYSSDENFPTGSTTFTVDVEGTGYTPPTMLNRKSGADDIVWNWRVRANFAAATGASSSVNVPGPWSVMDQFTVTWLPAISTPTLLGPIDASKVYSDLRFSWTPVEGAVKYHVVIGSASDGTNVTTILEEADTTATTYVPESQRPDAVYWWTVWALDPQGNRGGTPTPVSFTKAWGTQTGADLPAADYTPAYPVPTFGATTEAAEPVVPLDELLLTWEPLPRATMYEVQVVPHDGTPRLTCRTASTSATIVGKLGEGTTSGEYLEGDSTCLWTSTAAQRIRPGVEYTWRVRAVDFAGSAGDGLQGSGYSSGTRITQWSDMESSDWTRERHFQVSEPPAAVETAAVPDADAWAVERVESANRATPLMRWNRVLGANAYEVDVYRDAALTNHVGEFWTPQTVLRINGVFDDTTAGGYYWTVRAAYTTDWSKFAYFEGSPGSAPADWTKLSTPADFVGVTPAVTTPDGSVLLSWRPQALSGLDDGGSRGYRVQVFTSADTSLGVVDVENPWFVAVNPTGRKALTPGGYKFQVAALDALGNPGSYSAKQSFTVTVPVATDLGVTAPEETGSTTRTLAWATAAPYSRFVVQYAPSGSTTWTTVGGLVQAGTTLTNLAPGSYDWTVTTWLDSTGTSKSTTAAGPAFTVATPAPVPTTPEGATLTTDDRRLAWQPVPGASRYLVRFAETSTGATTATYAETSASSFVLPTNLTFGKQYYWTVTAVPEKKSTASNRVVLGMTTPRAFQVVTPPGIITLGTATAVGSSVQLKWTVLSGAGLGSSEPVQYRLAYRAKNTTGTPDAWQVVELGSGVAATTLSGLALNQTYEIKLLAWNGEGSGPWTTVKEVTTPTVPGSVTSLLASPAYQSLKVSWKAATNGGATVTSHHVQYRAVGTDSWTEYAGVVSGTATAVTITGLSGQKSYEVQVTAVNAAGEGPAATTTAVTIGAPTKPVNFTVKRGDAKVTLTWAAPSSNGGTAITGYVVETRAYSATTKTWGAWTVKARPLASVTTATVTSLTNGVQYQARMAAKSAYAQGDYTGALMFMPAGKPSAPTSVKATAGKGSITITWAKPTSLNGSTLSGYIVQYSVDNATWKSKVKTSATTTKYLWTGLTKGKSYYVRVIATSNIANSNPSASVRATVL